MPVRVEERLLNEVRRIDLALEALADLHAGQQGEVAPVAFEEPAESVGVARFRLTQQVFRVFHANPKSDRFINGWPYTPMPSLLNLAPVRPGLAG